MPAATKTKTTKTTKDKAKARAGKVSSVPCWTIPAVRGIQAGSEYYVAMMPIKLLAQSFLSTDEDLPADMRSQRIPNSGRVKKAAQYVMSNPRSYVFSSITASITCDSESDWEELRFDSAGGSDAGTLIMPMSARFLINDGQHRIAALIKAHQETTNIPDEDLGDIKKHLTDLSWLADETISVVLFQDLGLKRSQQIFHDLNNNVAKPTKSINLLYDHRSINAEVTRQVIKKVPLLDRYTDREKTSCGKKSRYLFSLNGIHAAHEILVKGIGADTVTAKWLAEFWSELAEIIPDWKQLNQGITAAGDIRMESIAGHAITLEAFAVMGVLAFTTPSSNKGDIRSTLAALQLHSLDWGRRNPQWEGMFIFGGAIKKNKTTAKALGEHLYSFADDENAALAKLKGKGYTVTASGRKYHKLNDSDGNPFVFNVATGKLTPGKADG